MTLPENCSEKKSSPDQLKSFALFPVDVRSRDGDRARKEQGNALGALHWCKELTGPEETLNTNQEYALWFFRVLLDHHAKHVSTAHMFHGLGPRLLDSNLLCLYIASPDAVTVATHIATWCRHAPGCHSVSLRDVKQLRNPLDDNVLKKS